MQTKPWHIEILAMFGVYFLILQLAPRIDPRAASIIAFLAVDVPFSTLLGAGILTFLFFRE